MTTVVNNPSGGESGGNGMGFFMGLVLFIVVLFIFIAYGLPALRGTSNNNIQLPGNGGGVEVPNINVPDQIDLNINSTK